MTIREAAEAAYPHRSPMIDAGYMAEDRSRRVLRNAFILGYRQALRDAAEIADHVLERVPFVPKTAINYTSNPPMRYAEDIAAAIRSLDTEEEK